ncbi:MAG: hypothetical protein SWH61_12955 [Thermodesulfobacteriota bacterium]|nr:hypothetical protein [Thermodesulfobacteriota bacterium]
MSIKINGGVKRDYDRIFRRDPEAANLFLLLTELADRKGRVITDPVELAQLMAVRFDDIGAYQLGAGGHE